MSLAAEVHISSLVVQCLPEQLDSVAEGISQLDIAEVHASDPKGKLIVVLETENEQAILETINQIQAIQGVINAPLVFHQID